MRGRRVSAIKRRSYLRSLLQQIGESSSHVWPHVWGFQEPYLGMLSAKDPLKTREGRRQWTEGSMPLPQSPMPASGTGEWCVSVRSGVVDVSVCVQTRSV